MVGMKCHTGLRFLIDRNITIVHVKRSLRYGITYAMVSIDMAVMQAPALLLVPMCRSCSAP